MLNYNPLTKEEREEAYQAAIADNNQWEKEEQERIKELEAKKEEKKLKRSNVIWTGIISFLSLALIYCGIELEIHIFQFSPFRGYGIPITLFGIFLGLVVLLESLIPKE